MPLVYTPRIYLLCAESQIIAMLRLTSLFKWPNPFEKVPGISKYFVVPNMDCVLLEASGPIQDLAAALREQFSNKVFVLAAINEADGLLPQAAWAFINAVRSQ
jgi:hypothetical protein